MDEIGYSVMTPASIEDDEFILYQQNPKKQILLYDMATSSSVLVFLKIHGIRTTIKHFTNTEYMSENGRMPVVIHKNNDLPMCGFHEVFRYVQSKLNLQPSLDELAYMDWVESNFLKAEMYICWCHEPVVNDYTKNRFTYDLPWPVSSILLKRKRQEMLNNVGKQYESYEDFLEKFNQFLTQLDKRLTNRVYCLGESPTGVDALIYGHSQAILSTNCDAKLTDAITRHRKIVKLRKLIDEEYPSFS